MVELRNRLKKISFLCAWILMSLLMAGEGLDVYGVTSQTQYEPWLQVTFVQEESSGWVVSAHRKPSIREWAKKRTEKNGISASWRVTSESTNGILELGDAYTNGRIRLGGSFEKILVTGENLRISLAPDTVIQVLEVDKQVESLDLDIDETANIQQIIGVEERAEEAKFLVNPDPSRKRKTNTHVNLEKPEKEEPEKEEPEEELEKEEPEEEDLIGEEDQEETENQEKPSSSPYGITVTESVYGKALLGSSDLGFWEVEAGEQVAIKAVSQSDTHRFKGWTRDDYPQKLMEENPYIFEMPKANILLGMVFVEEQVPEDPSVESPVPFDAGTGFKEDPYEISRVEQLIFLTEGIYSLEEFVKGADGPWNPHLLEAHYRLTEDLDLSSITEEQGWKPIGSSEPGSGNASQAFNGHFDGNGKTIRNLYIQRPRESGLGLFGEIGSSGVVENLRLLDPYVVGWSEVASLAAYNNGMIRDVQVVAREEPYSPIEPKGSKKPLVIVKKNRDAAPAGLLVAENGPEGILLRCGVEGVLRTKRDRQGLLAGVSSGVIDQCYAKGYLDSFRGHGIGGLVGILRAGSEQPDALVRDSYAIVQIGFEPWVGGGLLGLQTGNRENSHEKGTVVQNAYAVGRKKEGFNLNYGGLIGFGLEFETRNAYYDEDVFHHKSHNHSGTRKSTEALKSSDFPLGWSRSIWCFDSDLNDGYPVLQWQKEASYRYH